MAMLERVAVHQTRLRVPGVGLDASGVALGARGLVLLPSLDRLVAFLAVYSQDQSLEPLIESLRIEVARSKLGTREVVLSFAAGSSDRMDRVAEVARVVGGFVFTGTTRHYVQYRDLVAPFGYDALQIVATDAPIALYHGTFSQVYEVERTVELSRLLLSLTPHADPEASVASERVWVLAEPGLGPSLVYYFTRSQVPAEVGIAQWPPESSFDDTPVRRYLFLVGRLPQRMRPLLAHTPGIGVFDPSGPGVAVEHGFRHPVTLRSVPVFSPRGLVLFRGAQAPLQIDPVPVMARLSSLQQSDVALDRPLAGAGRQGPAVDLKVPIRLLPSTAPRAGVAATFVPATELALLRHATYVLGRETLQSTRIAITERGAFLTASDGAEVLPIGHFYRRYHPHIFVPSGLDVVPPVAPELLFGLLGSPREEFVFLQADGSALGIARGAFVRLDEAVVQADRWAPLPVTELASQLETKTPTVWLEPLGLRPLGGAKPAP
jgi:hypothetical protein